MSEENEEGEIGLSFIILADMEMPNPKKVMAAAHSMGIELSPVAPEPGDADEQGEAMLFAFGDNSRLVVALMPIPHPDVGDMMQGPLSPDNLEELVAAPAHLLVSALSLDGTVDEQDIRMSAMTASVVEACNALAVLKMPGRIFHRPDLFVDTAREAITNGELPMLICIDISIARESDDRLSLLTHNMERYGREDFYVFAGEDASEAIDYVFNLTSWMLSDREYHLPTGDTLGRTAEEKILVQRVPNPTGEGDEVIKLELT